MNDLRLDETAARARRLLASGPAAGLARATESSYARVGPPGPRDVQAIAQQLKLARATTQPTTTDPDRLATSLVERAQAAMTAIESGASLGSIGDSDAIALESVIRTRGRPALAIEGPRIEGLDPRKHPGSSFWSIPLNDHEMELIQVASVTGAVTVRDMLTGAPAQVRGTAWLIRPDLAMTNRHVVFPETGVRFAKRVAGQPTAAAIKTDFDVMLDFAFDDGPPRTERRHVTEVPYVSEEGDQVDVAILQLAGTSSASPPLSLAGAASASKQVYLFGHPGPVALVPDDVQAVFGNPNGRKRVCFGELMAADPRPGELVHDASTIGGFSGGCVLTFGSTDVSGLHYYGHPVRGNRAITAQALRTHAVAAFFTP